MRGQLIAITWLALGGAAHAQPAPPPAPAPEPTPPAPSEPAPSTPDGGAPAPTPTTTAPPAALPDTGASSEASSEDIADQAISAEVGAAAGSRITPGGLRIAGRYLYQLSDEDWFEGAADFTFGSSRAACFRNRQNKVICDHGLAQGAGIELTASVRRMFTPQGAFRPFARIGVGLGVARFGDDNVTGVTIPAHAGGGIRAAVAPTVSVVAEADLALGFSSFTRGVGSQVQLGLAVTAGAEFRLR